MVIWRASCVYTAIQLWYHLRVLAFLSEPSELVALAEKIAAPSSKYGLPQYSALATIMRGCAIARCGDPEAGRAIIGDGLAAYTATGAVSWSCYFRALLAETYQMTGETDEALHILLEALEDTERTGEGWYVAELHRRIGEAHRQRGAEIAAQQSFDQALSVARGQGAKLWELQAATSYARSLRDQGKPAEADALLSPIYAWFTEGFDTLPLREAKAVLDSVRNMGKGQGAVTRLRPPQPKGLITPDQEAVFEQAEPHLRRKFESAPADADMASEGSGIPQTRTKNPPAGAIEVPAVSQTDHSGNRVSPSWRGRSRPAAIR